jgi:CheY-like chemotaxis protein
MVRNTDIFNASILIVDDQEANVQLLEQLLREAGYLCVSSTVNPQEVCTLHRKNHYDLILLDLQMPGMDGFEVMEGLKTIEGESYLPVLVITAQPGHKLRALQAGAKDFRCGCYTKSSGITTKCWNKRCRNGPPNCAKVKPAIAA